MNLLAALAAEVMVWSVRGSLLLLPAIALVKLMNRRRAASRELTLRFVLIAFLMIPFIALLAPDVVVPAGSIEPGETFAEAVEPPLLATLLPLVWIGGAGIMLLRLTLGAIALRHRHRSSVDVDSPRFAALAEQIGLRRVPRLLTSADAGTAMTWGVFRSVVLVPRHQQDEDAVLLHELAHVARHDSAIVALGAVIHALHWFNPLVAVTWRLLRAESEPACDDLAVRFGAAPLDLAEQLVQQRTATSTPRLAMSMASGNRLEQRVIALLDPATPRSRPGHIARAAAVLLSLAGAAGVALVTARPTPAAASFARAYRIPEPLAQTIIDVAGEEQIQVDVAFALVESESGFDPTSVSDSGAIGLTQILPSTARTVQPDISRDQLFESSTNLRVGLRHLRTNVDRFGSLPEALTAYNIGAPAVDRLRTARQPLPREYADAVLGAVRR